MSEFPAGGHGYKARFGRVFEMHVAAGGADMLPAIALKLSEQIAVLHRNGGQTLTLTMGRNDTARCVK